MCMQNFIHSVQDIGQLSCFQNLDLGITSTADKCHFATLGLDLVNINVYAKFNQNIPHDARVMGKFRKLILDGHTTSQTYRGRIHNDNGQIT